MTNIIVKDENRQFLSLSGPDTQRFLQGMITNNVEKIAPGQPIYAAFLTPQGKFLTDFFVFPHEDALWIDVPARRAAMLHQKLSAYKLRMKVAIDHISDAFQTYLIWGDDLPPPTDELMIADPRLALMGFRYYQKPGAALPQGDFTKDDFSAYRHHRIQNMVPDGEVDLVFEQSIINEYGFEELNAIDYKKGCYLGQEMVARVHYRGLIRRRLLGGTVTSGAVQTGDKILHEGQEIGEIRSVGEDQCLAYVKLEGLNLPQDVTTEKGVTIKLYAADWMSLPAKEDLKRG